MALARILGCAFQKNHLFMRNASFYRDVYSTSKYAWFYTKTCANIRIEPNKWYEKVTSQKSEETEETKKVDAAKKHDRDRNKETKLKYVVYVKLVIIGIAALVVTAIIYACKSDIEKSVYMRTLFYCDRNPKIVDVLGEPITYFKMVQQKTCVAQDHHCDEEDKAIFHESSLSCEQFTFYVEGSKAKGLVEVNLKKIGFCGYEYMDLFVTVPTVETFQIVPTQSDLKEYLEWSRNRYSFLDSHFIQRH